MNWTLSQILTTAVSLCALALGIANFIHSRVSDRNELVRRLRDDRLNVDRLLDSAYDLLLGKGGLNKTTDSRKVDEAGVLVRQALQIEPNCPRAIEYEGYLFEILGKKKAAIARYERSLALDPSRARSHECLGLIKDNEDSIEHFKMAIGLDPEHADRSYCQLGRVYQVLGNLKEAENSFAAAVEISPKYQRALFALGNIARGQGHFDEARSFFERAIEADSSYIYPMVALGVVLITTENESDGIAWIEHAMKIDPTNDYPLAVLAKVFAGKKEPDKALSYATRAMALNPRRRFRSDDLADIMKDMNELLAQHTESNDGLK